MDTTFRTIASDVQRSMANKTNSSDTPTGHKSALSHAAVSVQKAMSGVHTAAEDHDAEWQRVNSYVADVLKDSHVLYAKLARLQGDFAGEELANLSKISEAVLSIGSELSRFSKAFYEGKYDMLQSSFTYGEGGGAPIPNSSPESMEAGAGGSPAESYDQEAPGQASPDMGDMDIPDYEAPDEEFSEEPSDEPSDEPEEEEEEEEESEDTE